MGLWIAQFTAFFGFSLFFPFIPLFLTQDLHVRSESQVALWAGIAASASGFSMAIFSPIWGAVADRFGRRQMVLRAMIGSGVVMLLMGVVQTPAQLAGTRFLFGITTGTMSATWSVDGESKSSAGRASASWPSTARACQPLCATALPTR